MQTRYTRYLYPLAIVGLGLARVAFAALCGSTKCIGVLAVSEEEGYCSGFFVRTVASIAWAPRLRESYGHGERQCELLARAVCTMLVFHASRQITAGGASQTLNPKP